MAFTSATQELWYERAFCRNGLAPYFEDLTSHLCRGPNSEPKDRECFTTIVAKIDQRLGVEYRPSCIVLVLGRTPMLADTGHFLSHDENDANSLRCCFELQLILKAHKSYFLAPQGGYTPSSCH